MEETVVLEEVALSLVGNGDARGKHRILAELARVEQEVTFLEDPKNLCVETCWLLLQELEELDQADIVSTVCEELLFVIEKRPDPLLPLTNGPLDLGWDRWFEGPNGGEGCRCLIL